MRKICFIVLFLTFFSCDKKEIKYSEVKLTSKDTSVFEIESAENRNLNTSWQDDLISYYVKNSKNELIVSALESKDNLDWQFDQTIKNDSTQFYIYKIGVHVTEEDGSEPRFSACGWVYLDSVKRKLYEYDLPNDTIIAWKK